ncbi:MAG: hypothetical protein AAF960_18340 [Bacteroidota bacterium]
MKKQIAIILCMSYAIIALQSQILVGLSAKWNDDFSEWLILTDDEAIEGDLRMTWPMQRDWSSFDYRIEEASGNIKIKWRNNPNEWETRGDNHIITARTRWKDDPREWRITNNDFTLLLKSKWGNNPNVWILTDEKYGYFEMRMYNRDDFREWEIIDELDDAIPLAMKMTMVFLVMYHSTPRL